MIRCQFCQVNKATTKIEILKYSTEDCAKLAVSYLSGERK